MSQLLKPKALPLQPFETVELVFGKNWKWKIPTRFGFGIRSSFDKIQTDECFSWLSKVMNEAQLQKNETAKEREAKERAEAGIPPSQILEPENQLGRILSSALEQLIIPEDKDISKHIGKFLWYNNLTVLKKQLDLLLIPLDDAPLASTVIDEADEESIGSVFSYFFDVVNPKKKAQLQSKDSGKSSRDLNKQTQEKPISKQKEKSDS